MKRFLLWLLCLAIAPCSAEEPARELLPLSTPEQIGAFLSDSSRLIGGLVSPIDGHPTLREVDLVVQGAQPIVLDRIYLSPYVPIQFAEYEKSQEEHNRRDLFFHLYATYEGWRYFPHTLLVYYPELQSGRLREPSGATLHFRLIKGEWTVTTPHYGMSNFSGGEPSGKSDLRNLAISWDSAVNQFMVRAADGTLRTYREKREVEGRGCRIYALQKEVLPNGRVLKYLYDRHDLPMEVQSYDPTEQHLYASLRFTPGTHSLRWTTSSGLTVDQSYESRDFRSKIKSGGHTDKLEGGAYPDLLVSSSSPHYRNESWRYDERLLLTSVGSREQQAQLHYAPFGSPAHYRVQRISLPLGAKGEMRPAYQIDYTLPIAGEKEGATRVTRQDGCVTLYRFSKELLPNSIEAFDPQGGLRRQERFLWDEQRHWLTGVEIGDGERVFLRKSYALDDFGNPVVETLAGDLTGSGEESSYTIWRQFSNDGRHLLLRQEEENGLAVAYSYLPNSDRVTRKLVGDGEQILRREFFRYDPSHNLVEEVVDDGSGEEADDLAGVTQRTIRSYRLRQEPPFLHMPEWIEERYWEEGTEKLLERRHLIRDQHGRVACEEVYDADNVLAYTIEREHNERGDITAETNRLGQRALYGYTERGDRDLEVSFSGRLQTRRRFDRMRRLCEEKRQGDEGEERLQSWEYGLLSRPLCQIDRFGNRTAYSYDPVLEEVERTEYPAIASLEGRPVAVEHSARYDALKRTIEETDANGHRTSRRYNAYGSVAEVIYPDGSRESYRYATDGSLLSATDPDGLTTLYERDLLGRPLHISLLSASGELLAEESCTYSGFQRLTHTDKEGHLTRYSYDGSGRKTSEERAGRRTDYRYSPLGYLAEIEQHNGESSLITQYDRDLEGRVLEERRTDRLGKLLYKVAHTYDSDGNRSSTTRWIGGEPSTQSWSFDPFGRLIEERDGSYVVQRSYEEQALNRLGQRVLQTTTRRPLGVTLIETRDALGRLVQREEVDRIGRSLAHEEWTLDPQGDPIQQYSKVFDKGEWLAMQRVQYRYTPRGRLKSCTQAFGEPEASTTFYTYSPSGKIKSKVLPDGVVLAYQYTPLGYLSRLDSSDGAIAHRFRHNKLGDLLEAVDEKQGVAIERQVDPFGNVVQERLPHRLLQKRYDALDRPISLRIEGVGEIVYRYDPLYLREVQRLSPDGRELYTHRYEAYDLAGHLLSEELIGAAGRVDHTTDSRGLPTEVSSPYFAQQWQRDAEGNVLESREEGLYRYSYDGRDQLVAESGPGCQEEYSWDSLYNPTAKRGWRLETDSLNQLVAFGETRYEHDLNGNLLNKGEWRLRYDPLHRLVEATAEGKRICFSYDPIGRRLSRTIYEQGRLWGWWETREEYLYDGQHEIGALLDGELRSLKVLGRGELPVAIELEGRAYAPLLDLQRNPRKLVDLRSHSVTSEYAFSAFGEELRVDEGSGFNPWRFGAKRWDPDLRLVCFGERDYDPELGRWLTPDPEGFRDALNLYQYVFNNPLRYCDPDGRFVFVIPLVFWGAGLAFPTMAIVGEALLYSAVTAGVVWAGYKCGEALNQRREVEVKTKKGKKKTIAVEDGYAPSKPLPNDEDGESIPEADAPHTQIGTRESKSGYKYRQGREFDKDGNVVERTDFTDHGDPKNHPCPHRHRYEPNPSSGSPIIKKAEPLPPERWKY